MVNVHEIPMTENSNIPFNKRLITALAECKEEYLSTRRDKSKALWMLMSTERKRWIAPSKKAIKASSFHGAVNIAYFDVRALVHHV
ncbi:hypothetical protein T05_7881 [Trichinella murrelli]|uniref:Uncharacterized protein n=1 Tax=Trichinella murrelli TaxID=144512 RepID=A0A0V0T8P2_9BILA|nr:hypothetical protein T05_7881 [Trichinella murrelli]